MLQAIARNWWILLVQGLCAIAFGVLAFVWPEITLFVLVILFGAYALVDGIFAVVLGFSGRADRETWWAMVLLGLMGIAAGIVTFVWPGITAAVLLGVFAAWALVRGVLEIVAAIRLRRVLDNEWLLVVAGVLSILFGIALLVWPDAGLVVMTWIAGAYVAAFGILMVALALRLRSLRARLQEATVPHGARFV